MKPIPAPPDPVPEDSLPIDELYARFRAELPEAFRRLRIAGSDAQDCTQLALERIWQSAATFPRELSAARIMMFSIAASIAQAWRRRTARRARRHVDHDPTLVPNGVDEAAVARWFHIMECVDALEQPYREVFIEHDIEGHPASHIARAMNTTESIVRFRLSKARAQLRDALGKDEEPKSRRAAVVPLFGAGLGLTDLDRAVLSAAYRAEGRKPLVGGPSDPPPPPPREPPLVTPKALPVPLALTPKAAAALLGGLVALPAGAFGVFLLLSSPRPEFAHDGLYVPQICLGDAVPAPALPPVPSPAPASTTAAPKGTSKSRPPSPSPPAASTPSSHPSPPTTPLDADALSRARKNLPTTFSVSDPKPK